MRNVVLILVLLTTSPTFGSPLFDENSILEVTISGPLSTLLKHKRNREEYPFSLTVDDAPIDVAVRIRGNSRVVVCRFPPLRLNFTASGTDGTVLAGEDKLKLVTHCQNGSEKSQNSVLNEFTAYRIFNLISDRSYRVRLLQNHWAIGVGPLQQFDCVKLCRNIDRGKALNSAIYTATSSIKVRNAVPNE